MQTNRDLPEDFWQPKKIDWAEDAEEEFLKNEAISASLTPSKQFDWAEDAEEEFLKNEATLTPSDHCDCTEDKEEEIFKNEAAILSSPLGRFSEETTFADDTSDTSSEDILTFSCERTARSWEYMQEEVDDEFGSRHEHIHYVGNPHHFNWQGKPVMERSSTRPEESLAVMLAKPKIPRLLPDSPDTDDWVDRIQVIVRNASRFIDPVLLILDEVDESILDLRGSALQQASKGHVLKYYTGHGWWMVDGNEAMEDYNLDIGDVGSYLEPNVMVGNGFVAAGGLPTREEWQSLCDGMVSKVTSKCKKKSHRKRDWKPKPSGLRQVTTLEPHDAKPNMMPTFLSLVPFSDTHFYYFTIILFLGVGFSEELSSSSHP
ncbi:hypothetical protein N7451_009830 [Penicillium sp. IBT 35674x]|nr:hypothetical protein N7451_009830 [Penicillium sp. IBT 35674x]